MKAVKQTVLLTCSEDKEDVRFSADATWSVDATVNLGSTASLRLGVELLLRLTSTLPCNIPPDASCKRTRRQSTV